MTPFLKWAGGKRWLANQLAPFFEGHEGRYLEPFLGSGAIFFRYCPTNAILSDTNEELISCYQALRNEPEDVKLALVHLSARDPNEHYYAVRDFIPANVAERAARFLYLNRTCWNGLYRVNKKGIFNVPRGTKTQVISDSDDFPAIGTVLSGAILKCCDFEETVDLAEHGDIVFADPPYTVKHNFNGFVKYNQQMFSWSDQERLASALSRAAKRGAIVIATNADHHEVRDLYINKFKLKSLSRSSIIAGASNSRGLTTELFIQSDG